MDDEADHEHNTESDKQSKPILPHFEAIQQESAAPKTLISVPSLASLKAKLQTLTHAKELIKNDFDIYSMAANKLLKVNKELESSVINYMKARLIHDCLKKNLWVKIHDFKSANKYVMEDESFFKNELPEMQQQYKAAIEQRWALESDVANNLSSILKIINKRCQLLTVSTLELDIYTPPSSSILTEEPPAKRMKVSDDELNNVEKLEALIEKISSEFRKDIGDCLSAYIENCKLIENILKKLNAEVIDYRATNNSYESSKDNLWQTVTSMLKENQPDFNAKKAFKDVCVDLSTAYENMASELRTWQLGLQKHLHNAVLYRQQRSAMPEAPRIKAAFTLTITKI